MRLQTMPAAPGAAAAVALFSAGDVSQWSRWLSAYDVALERVAGRRKEPSDLLALDTWLRQQWPREASKSSGLTREALEKIARWKLSRGHWRPLLPRIMSNPQPAVDDAWRAAADAVSAGVRRSTTAHSAGTVAAVDSARIWKAVSALTTLDGVGPATASAILAPCFEEVPFMSDEAVLATGCALKYDAKTYKLFAQSLGARAEALGHPWTAERLGRALWACAVLGPDDGGAALGRVAAPSKKRPAGQVLEPLSKRPATQGP